MYVYELAQPTPGLMWGLDVMVRRYIFSYVRTDLKSERCIRSPECQPLHQLITAHKKPKSWWLSKLSTIVTTSLVIYRMDSNYVTCDAIDMRLLDTKSPMSSHRQQAVQNWFLIRCNFLSISVGLQCFRKSSVSICWAVTEPYIALVKISRTCKMSHYSCWVNISATLRLSNNVILKYDL